MELYVDLIRSAYIGPIDEEDETVDATTFLHQESTVPEPCPRLSEFQFRPANSTFQASFGASTKSRKQTYKSLDPNGRRRFPSMVCWDFAAVSCSEMQKIMWSKMV